MNHLIRSKKADLITLVIELGLNPPENANKSALADMVVKSDGYDEDFVKNLLSGIVSEREEEERNLKTKEVEDCEYQLKILELENNQKTQVINSAAIGKGPDVLKLLKRYDNEEERFAVSIVMNYLTY